MKFVAPATLALAATFSLVAGQACDLASLATELVPIISPATACQTATGYAIIPPTALPTAAQVTAICSQCTALISAATGISFPTCTLTLSDGSSVALNELFNQVAGQCSGSSSGSATSATVAANSTASTASSNASDTPTVTTTATPTPTTSTGSSSTESSSTGSEAESPSTDVSTPSTTTTSAPSTNESAGVAARLGAAVAVACSLAVFAL